MLYDDRPWLKSYNPGVGAEIEISGPSREKGLGKAKVDKKAMRKKV